MPRLKLIVLPDGRCIVTSEDRLDTQETERINETWESWKRDKDGLLILPDVEVVTVKR